MTQPPKRRIRETPSISHSSPGESAEERWSDQQASGECPADLASHRTAPTVPSTITPDNPVTLGGLAIVPLRSNRLIKKKHSVKMGVRQLDKAGVEIRELDGHGSVPMLHAENHTKHHVLFIEGDQLIGAKQNRVCNSTVLLYPKSKARIPVSCVEEGRWRHISRTFGSSKYHASPSLRRKLSKTKESSRRASGGQQQHSADQSLVWQHVCSFSQQAGVQSQTKAMQEVYEAHEVRLQEHLKENSAIENSKAGSKAQFTVTDCPNAIHGWILQTPDDGISIDIFGSPKLCRLAWRRIIGSAAMEAMIYQNRSSRHPSRATDSATSHPKINLRKPKAVRKLIKAVQNVTLEKVTPVAAGFEQRIVNSELSGSYMTLENRLVHLGLTV